jgi:hypothetical protein
VKPSSLKTPIMSYPPHPNYNSHNSYQSDTYVPLVDNAAPTSRGSGGNGGNGWTPNSAANAPIGNSWTPNTAANAPLQNRNLYPSTGGNNDYRATSERGPPVLGGVDPQFAKTDRGYDAGIHDQGVERSKWNPRSWSLRFSILVWTSVAVVILIIAVAVPILVIRANRYPDYSKLGYTLDETCRCPQLISMK